MERSVGFAPGRGPAPGRLQRMQERRRRMRRAALLAVLAVLAATLLAAWFARDRAPGPARGAGPSAPPTLAPSTLVALAVRTETRPLVAVVGSGGGRPPAAVTIEPSLVVNLPGQGEGRFGEAIDQPAPYVRLATSNLMGAWIDHVVVLNGSGLAALVDRAGGATVGGFPWSGQQVADSFAVSGPDRSIRWLEVLESLLAGGIELEAEDVVAVDDLEGARRALGEATGAVLQPLPAIRSEGGLLRPDDPQIDVLTATEFAIQGPAVPLIVLNGTGHPGLGQEVAEALIPQGFRVVISQNATEFDHRRTQIVVSGEDVLDAARMIRRVLGVGRVVTEGVPSGLADITIVVGRDYRTG